jgi:hypothetical protein
LPFCSAKRLRRFDAQSFAERFNVLDKTGGLLKTPGRIATRDGRTGTLGKKREDCGKGAGIPSEPKEKESADGHFQV